MLHPEDYAAVSASVADKIHESNGNMDYVEYRIIRKDGSVRWVEDYGRYTETETCDGFVSGITGQRAQKELERRPPLQEEL